MEDARFLERGHPLDLMRLTPSYPENCDASAAGRRHRGHEYLAGGNGSGQIRAGSLANQSHGPAGPNRDLVRGDNGVHPECPGSRDLDLDPDPVVPYHGRGHGLDSRLAEKNLGLGRQRDLPVTSQSAPWALAAVRGLGEFHSSRQQLGKYAKRRGDDQSSGAVSDHGAESAKTFPVHARVGGEHVTKMGKAGECFCFSSANRGTACAAGVCQREER